MRALTAGCGRPQYECGKVCLSLLNTWAGRNSEVWDSTSSSILQARPLAGVFGGGVLGFLEDPIPSCTGALPLCCARLCGWND